MDPAPRPAEPPDPTPAAAPTEGPALDLDAVTADLAAVEAALERLDAGTYGTCAHCTEVIDAAVLEDDPTATACAAHLRL